MKLYYVYIMTNRSKTLYIGVTNNLQRRMDEHQNHLVAGFTSKYHIARLVYYEETSDVYAALAREKQIKGWVREKKIAFEWRGFMTDHLRFGLTSMNAGATSYPEALVRVAQAAETAGFDSLWAGEHHVIATSSSRIPATTRYLNPLVALTFIAAHTRTIRLGTGVLLLPQHHPLILAKELASLDVLSGGRLMVGIGVGWAEAEFEALGVPYRERGARADEYLAAMRAIWSEDTPAYHGRYVSFKDVQAFPHPVQQPTPPIIVGGRAPAVLRRAVEQANGWYGFALDVDETAIVLAELREVAKRYHRPASLGELEISVAPRVPIDKEMAQRFAQLGVHRLILIPPPGRDAPALEQWVKSVGETLVGQV